MNELNNAKDSIKVCVRIRPLNEKEKSRNSVSIWKTASNNTIYHHFNPSSINNNNSSGNNPTSSTSNNNNNNLLSSSASSSSSLSSLLLQQQQQNNGNNNDIMSSSNNNNNGIPTSYTFDHVYDQQSSTELIYSEMCKHIVIASVRGYNGTIFAYGQTSSGKTFTMKGSKDLEGIIPLSIRDVFTTISQTPDRAFQIRVSYLEIYNEIINDLLDIENKKLKIREDLSKGVYVEGATEEEVSDIQQVLRLMERGEHNRHFGATNMNDRSSRSHTIFRITIESMDAEIAKRVMEDDENLDMSSDSDSNTRVLYSTLNLVDLAGSERVSNTLAEGQRLKEGAAINKSLFTLGKVISKLSEGNSAHIPYRDSKLTRILQSALGGNSKTVIICTVTPALQYFEETQSTLSFANRAKSIQNSVTINEILGDKALLKKLKKENAELKSKLLTEITRLEKEKKECIRHYEEKFSLLQSSQFSSVNDEQEKASLKKLIQEKEKDLEWIQALSKSSQQRLDEELKHLQHTLSSTIENSNQTISAMKFEHEKIIAQFKQDHEQELERLKTSHQQKLEELTLQLSQKYEVEQQQQQVLNSHLHEVECELNKHMTLLHERIKELESCKEDLETQIQTLNLEHLEHEKTIQMAHDTTKSTLEHVQQELSHLTHTHEQEIQTLRETIEKLHTENQSKEFEISSLKEAIDSLSQLLKEKEEAMEELEYDFGMLQSQVKQQQQQQISLELTSSALSREGGENKSESHSNLEELVQQKDAYISQLQDEITLKEQAFKREIDDAVERIKELEEEKESIVTGMSSKLEEMNRLLVENKTLHKQNEELKSKIEYGKARSQRLIEERKRKEVPSHPLTPRHECDDSINSTPCSQEFKKCKLSTPPSLDNVIHQGSNSSGLTTGVSSSNSHHHYFMNTSLEKLEDCSSLSMMTMNKENKIN
ncbi:hypothetical protein C9374_006617 [Naegleria lovaniensis]|uniref:Kinesin-like protein n=1 Tax=Naegleria lovaniensis TaxID=51637 RepID=A0AA88GMH5_NAELO|nr:uncharacterized protein C9374_006617 [Naegleria lovaniensis]KAG2379500.1 hypothetical protein C9374_006617 [Naegleria lovaniensis]